METRPVGGLRQAWAGAVAAWRELRAAARHAPLSVRRYRLWASLLAITTTALGITMLALVASLRAPYPGIWHWAAGVAIGNAAFLQIMAFPPRTHGAYKLAWRFSVLWLAGTGFFAAPLLVLAIPAYASLCDERSAAWYRASKPPEEGPPRRPLHPWGYAREPVPPAARRRRRRIR